MTAIKQFLQWLVLSSKDPEKQSFAFKGILVGAVTWLGLAAGILHYNLPLEQINGIVSALVDALQATLTVISFAATAYSAIATVWGLARKLYSTWTGTNKVIIAQVAGRI